MKIGNILNYQLKMKACSKHFMLDLPNYVDSSTKHPYV